MILNPDFSKIIMIREFILAPAYKISSIIDQGTGYVDNATGAQTIGGSGSGLELQQLQILEM